MDFRAVGNDEAVLEGFFFDKGEKGQVGNNGRGGSIILARSHDNNVV